MSHETWIRRATGIYRGLLPLYTKRFRDAYGEEMVGLFRERLNRASLAGSPALVAATLAAFADVAWSAMLDRAADLRRGGRGRAPRRDSLFLRAYQELRFATRRLARQPSLVVTVVLTLTLGVGATIALFAIADAAVLRPLPYPEAERLVSIVQDDPRFGLVPFGPPYLRDLRERAESFDAIVGFSPSWGLTLRGRGEPRRVLGAYVSDGVLDLLGVQPLEGRAFVPEDFLPGGAGVALVTRSFWDSHLGGDRPFSPTSIRLDDSSYTVAGIVPSSVRLPITSSVVSQRDEPAEVLLPFSANPYAEARAIPVMNVVGRLREGVTLDAATAELGSVGEGLARDYPETSRLEVEGVLLRDLVTRSSRGTVWMLFGAASFLLLIACANIANLLLARAADRQTELAIRASLGARRRQITVQLLTESGLLAVAGSAFGLLLAWWVLESIPALGLAGLPPSAVVRVDPRAAAFSLLLAVVTALLFGLAPALHASRTTTAGVLRSARSSRRGRARDWLVASEIALALSLLVGAGLLGRSFWNLVHVDPGFRAAGLLGVPLDLTADAYGPAERRAFVAEILRRLESLPEVSSAGAVNRLPLSGSNVFVEVDIEGFTPTDERSPVVDRRVVTPGYLATMGIPILEGRDVGASDSTDATPVAVVNETFARRFVPEGALGRRVRLHLQSGPGPWLTIVGVAGDVRHHGLDASSEPELYVPYAQAPVGTLVAVARTSRDPLSLAERARVHVWALDGSIPLDGLGAVSSLVQDSVAEPRFRMLVLNGFGALALLLAALGVYGVTAYTVTCQTREIGVRMALGAQTRSVLGLVVGRGMRLAVWGVGLGIGGGVLVSRLLRGLLFGVTHTDAPTYAVMSLLLLGVAALASYVPARRATRVDPVEALRLE